MAPLTGLPYLIKSQRRRHKAVFACFTDKLEPVCSTLLKCHAFVGKNCFVESTDEANYSFGKARGSKH